MDRDALICMAILPVGSLIAVLGMWILQLCGFYL